MTYTLPSFTQKSAIKPLILAAALLTAGLSNLSQAALPTNPNYGQAMQYGLLNFSANASKKVDNDQVNATLSKTVQNKNSAEVAVKITQTLNQAMIIAKKYPQVKVSTGNQNTYPQYDKNQKIIGWTGNANLYLKSTDTVAMSNLIAELQSFMNLDGLDFSVSDDLRKKIEQELMVQASKNFQAQAATLLPAWNARDYQLVSLDFNQGYTAMPMARGYYTTAVSAKEMSVPAQDYQAGESTITVNANGVIQLVK